MATITDGQLLLSCFLRPMINDTIRHNTYTCFLISIRRLLRAAAATRLQFARCACTSARKMLCCCLPIHIATWCFFFEINLEILLLLIIKNK